MLKSRRRFLSAWAVSLSGGTVLFLNASVASSTSMMAQERATVTVELASSTTLGLPMVGAYVVANRTSGAIRVDAGDWDRKSALRFELISPGGKHASAQPTRPPEGGIHVLPQFVVDSGATFRESFVLDQWLDLSTVGRYSATIRLEGSFQASNASSVIDVERTTTRQFDVLPRDQKKIRARCQQLVDVIAKRGPGWFDAADELVYVRDAVAVPYLRDAILASTPNRSKAIDALVGIGGPEARGALVTLSGSPEQFLASSAKAALQRIK
jgi:hypothetical protein